MASLYTKNSEIHIDKVNYIRDQPITLVTLDARISIHETMKIVDASVSCGGGDRAPNCDECDQDYGWWCDGDCSWVNDQCIRKGKAISSVQLTLHPSTIEHLV